MSDRDLVTLLTVTSVVAMTLLGAFLWVRVLESK
jgi:hypothetical protein